MNQLEVLRESLGQCDEIILDALLMRNRIVEDIMVYKEANNVPILQPEQEAKQKEWLERRMQEKRHKNEVADVFESITRNSKKIQARKLFNYNIVLIGFMGAGKSTISGSHNRVCHGYHRDGSDHRRACRYEHLRYFRDLRRTVFP